MRNLISRAAIAAGALVLGVAYANALTASTSLNVSASVAQNCVVGTTPVNFGNIPSTLPGGPANPTANGGVQVTCTNGTLPTDLTLGNGANFIGGVRNMAAGANDISYELYSDAPKTTAWYGPGTEPVLLAGTGAVQNYTVYGQITQGGAVVPGNYTDLVSVTLTY
jgi:spore coat protein U-like protein